MTVLINATTLNTVNINDTEARVIGPNGVINETSSGVNFTNGIDSALLFVSGLISHGFRGVTMDGNDKVVVAQNGNIVGTTESDDGIRMNGDNNRVTISGTVDAPDFGIYQSSGSENGGTVTITETGVVQGGSDSNGAEATAFSAAIASLSDIRVVNNGDIIGEFNPNNGKMVAFAQAGASNATPDGFDRTTDAEATIINTGVINGDVIMGDGDDKFLARTDGVVFGRVALDAGDDLFRGANAADNALGGNGNDTMGGGGGDDTLNGNNGADSVFGGDGNDEINGSSGLDTLRGNMGNDTLNGGDNADMLYDGGGNDLLIGAAGNDTLTSYEGDDTLNGGNGFDRFDFNGNFGADVITNFSDNNAEKIDLSDVHTIRNFTDLQNNHLSQDGPDAVIDAGNGNSITIQGFNANQLDNGDFIF